MTPAAVLGAGWCLSSASHLITIAIVVVFVIARITFIAIIVTIFRIVKMRFIIFTSTSSSFALSSDQFHCYHQSSSLILLIAKATFIIITNAFVIIFVVGKIHV